MYTASMWCTRSLPIVASLAGALLASTPLHLAAQSAAIAEPAAVDPEPKPQRRVRLEESEGRRDLHDFAATWHDAETWRARAAQIRAHIVKAADLDPLPPRVRAEPITRPPILCEGYSVQPVAFQALPGFYVTGNLYRPTQQQPPFAAVLCPHGHFQPTEEHGGGRFRPDMQIRCATLARMGAVVFAYDMAGWGESTQVEHNHADALTLQLLSSIRAVDFLQGLPGVDPTRIGITGASGGGTQSFLLAAVDERLTASVPVVMVSAHFFGGCLCESGKLIHESELHRTNNCEIAALAAPRPQLIVSCGEDWTKNTPEVEFPYIQSVYQTLGAGEDVANVHRASEGHDYGPSKRAPMLRFLARHLGLDLAAVTKLDGGIDESDIRILTTEELLVFTPDEPRPAEALQGREAVMAALRAGQHGQDGRALW
jgi:uncharacterized protein